MQDRKARGYSITANIDGTYMEAIISEVVKTR